MRCHPGVGILLLAGTSITLAAATDARAQTSPNDNVAAEALFEDARTLVAAGKYAEACPKFADSERLSPSVATLLNLANCWEKAGRTASAWATYREAASAANAAGRKDYLATALRRADGLSTKLARLIVTVSQPAPGMGVKRDGVSVDSAEWGVGIPVDTGPHTVEATAPGRKSWSITVDIPQDGAQSTVGIPPLEEAPASEAAVAAPPPAASAPPETPAAVAPSGTPLPPEPPPSSGPGGQRIAGVILGGVGVGGLVVGGVLALGAKSKYNDSLSNCGSNVGLNGPNSCTGTGVSQRNDARNEGNVATVFVGVGAAALVAGGVLWFSAPHGRSSAAAFEVAPTLGGFIARGAW